MGKVLRVPWSSIGMRTTLYPVAGLRFHDPAPLTHVVKCSFGRGRGHVTAQIGPGRDRDIRQTHRRPSTPESSRPPGSPAGRMRTSRCVSKRTARSRPSVPKRTAQSRRASKRAAWPRHSVWVRTHRRERLAGVEEGDA
eukprot:920940-Rhodomonas_salina.2